MIWLIGNKGMLGRKVELFLQKNKIDYLSSDREIDITDKNILSDFVKDKKISWIINCAAYTAVDKAEDEKELVYKLNSDGAENIAYTAKLKNAKLIHISTDYVYDGFKNTPYVETDNTNPLSTYGKSKLAGDDKIINLIKNYFIIRTSWLYGENGKNFVTTMIKLMNEKDKISVVNDQKGSPTFTTDLADFIIHLINIDSNKFGIYNFSNEGEISWFDFALKIYELAKKKGLITKNTLIEPIPTDQYPTKAIRPKYSVFSKEKIKTTFGYKIRNWEDALEEFIMNMETA